MILRRFVTTRLPDDPMSLSRVTRELADEYINIEGYSYEAGDLRILTDHPTKAHEVLQDLGFRSRIEELVQVDLENDPGSLSVVIQGLADAGVTVAASFGHAGKNGIGTVFLRVDDLKATERTLEDLQSRSGIRLIR
jgi:hypothetical protein